MLPLPDFSKRQVDGFQLFHQRSGRGRLIDRFLLECSRGYSHLATIIHLILVSLAIFYLRYPHRRHRLEKVSSCSAYHSRREDSKEIILEVSVTLDREGECDRSSQTFAESNKYWGETLYLLLQIQILGYLGYLG